MSSFVIGDSLLAQNRGDRDSPWRVQGAMMNSFPSQAGRSYTHTSPAESGRETFARGGSSW